MPIKRISMSIEDEFLFEKLKKKYKMTNDEALSYCVRAAMSKANELEDIKNTLDRTLEYIKLMVKVNKDLPQNDDYELMRRTVNSTSRFEELIEDKLKKVDEKR